jgi:hypothetical protein
VKVVSYDARMLDDKRKGRLDAMTKEEMVAEIGQGRLSRFNDASRGYMQARVNVSNEQEGQAAQTAQQGSAQRAHELAGDANKLQSDGNAIARGTSRLTGYGVGATLLAALIAWIAYKAQ